MQLTNKEQEESWRKDPKNWKMGNFYFNKEDNRTFVEKIDPMYGVTVNFANPKAYLFLLVAAAFFGFII